MMERPTMKAKTMMETIKRYESFVGIGILFFFLSSCAHSAKTPLPSQDRPENKDIYPAYQIGPEDVLEVLVWKNEDLSTQVIVRPDGKISLPLIGDVQAAGLTAVQLTEGIKEKLKQYYQEPPDVSVIVRQINSYAVYILGEVRRPGKYVVKSGTNFLQGIALAGGFTEFASTNNIQLLRQEEGGEQSTVTIRYKDILSGQLENNILLKPGDTLVVP